MERLTEWSYLAGVMVGDLKAGVDERKAFNRLAAYEDAGLEPETVCDLLGRFNSLYAIFADLDIVDRVHFQEFLELVRRWYQAEKDGRLVVLPCKPGDELIMNGLAFKADHWNVLLTAFADDASAPLGKRVKLFSPEEAEAALKRGRRRQDDN